MFSPFEIPGYREAVTRERAARDASFIDAPETLAGFPVAPMTLRRYLALKALRHPILCGGAPTPWQLVGFLWLMNSAYAPNATMPRPFARKARRLLSPFPTRKSGFRARLQTRRWLRAQEAMIETMKAVNQWLDAVFMDAGPSQGGNGFCKEYWSVGCGLILSLARETGWSERDILDIPLTRLFQYQKILAEFKGSTAPKFNPSDRVLSQYLKTHNRN